MRPSKKRLAHFPPRARFHVPRVPALPQLPRARSGARRAHTALDTSAVSARAGQGHDACVVIEHARAVQPEGALRAAARPLFQAPLQHRTFSASKTRMASMIIMKPSFIPPPRRPNRAPRTAPPRPKPPPKRCRGANIAPACVHTALHTPPRARNAPTARARHTQRDKRHTDTRRRAASSGAARAPNSESAGGSIGCNIHTSLVVACHLVVKLLLEAGADEDAQSASGSTVLHTAARFGRMAIVEVLLVAGCNTELADKTGSTPLMRLPST